MTTQPQPKPFVMLTFEEWFDRYNPVTDKPLELDIDKKYIVDNKPISVRRALAVNPHTVWTQVEFGNNLYIVNRLAFVNRLAYYITKEPYKPTEDIEVLEFVGWE